MNLTLNKFLPRKGSYNIQNNREWKLALFKPWVRSECEKRYWSNIKLKAILLLIKPGHKARNSVLNRVALNPIFWVFNNQFIVLVTLWHPPPPYPREYLPRRVKIKVWLNSYLNRRDYKISEPEISMRWQLIRSKADITYHLNQVKQELITQFF